MNSTKLGIVITLFFISVGYAVYLSAFKVPSLEKTINDYKNTPPRIDTVLVDSKIDSSLLYDDSVRNTKSSGPVLYETAELLEEIDKYERELVHYKEMLEQTEARMSSNPQIKKYRTQVQDTIITGYIYNTVVGEGYLEQAEFSYQFNRPIYATVRTNTVFVKETRIVSVPGPKTFRVQVGGFAGASPDGRVYLGPSIGFLNKEDNWFGYSYDVINGGHIVSYRTTIRFDFIKKIDLNPFK